MMRTRLFAALVSAASFGAAALLPIFLLAVPVAAQGLDRSSAQTSGFGFGARALGMGGAFIAIADDASAASWNPGGLGQLQHRQLTLSGSFNHYETATSADEAVIDFAAGGRVRQLIEDNAFEGRSNGLEFASLVQPVALGSRSLVLSLSYLRDARAVNGSLPFEVRTFGQAPGPSLGERPASYLEIVEKATGSGGADSVGLGLATSFGNVYVGGAVSYYRGEVRTVSQERLRLTSLLDEDGDAQSLLTADFETIDTTRWKIRALSFNLGVLWKPASWLSLGAVYRSGWRSDEQIELTYRTRGYDRDLIEDGRYFDLSLSYSGSAALTFPDAFGGGFALRPVPPLTVAFDATFTRWSRGAATGLPGVERNETGVGCPPACLVVVREDIGYPSEAPLDTDLQRDQIALRLGVEYVLRPGGLLFPMRLGAYRLPAIAPLFADRVVEGGESFDTRPRAPFLGLTAGLGVVISIGTESRVLFDLAGVVESADSGFQQTEPLESVELPGIVTRSSERRVTNRRLVGSLIVYF